MKKNRFMAMVSAACLAAFTALNAMGCSEAVDQSDEVGQEAQNHGISHIVQTTNEFGQTQLSLFDASFRSLGALTYERSDTFMRLQFSWRGDAYDVIVDGPQDQSRTSIMVNGVPVVEADTPSDAARMPLSIKPALDLAASLVIDAGLQGANADENAPHALEGMQGYNPTALECWFCATSYYCFLTTLSNRAKVYGHWDPKPICVEEVWGCGC